MQEKILILSRCQGIKKENESFVNFYRFHFRGYYQGYKINMIHVICENNIQFQKGDDYLLWVEHLKHSKTILEVQLIKYKKIG
jgi:hypothetical protein